MRENRVGYVGGRRNREDIIDERQKIKLSWSVVSYYLITYHNRIFRAVPDRYLVIFNRLFYSFPLVTGSVNSTDNRRSPDNRIESREHRKAKPIRLLLSAPSQYNNPATLCILTIRDLTWAIILQDAPRLFYRRGVR